MLTCLRSPCIIVVFDAFCYHLLTCCHVTGVELKWNLPFLPTQSAEKGAKGGMCASRLKAVDLIFKQRNLSVCLSVCLSLEGEKNFAAGRKATKNSAHMRRQLGIDSYLRPHGGCNRVTGVEGERLSTAPPVLRGNRRFKELIGIWLLVLLI